MKRRVYDLLYGDEDIYRDAPELEYDLQGWGGHYEYFSKLIDEVKPGLIVEVGTWKGRSAMSMARRCRELGLDTELVCIDTWLGATEFLEDHNDEKRYKSLNHLNGYPQVYYTFLNNVVHDDYGDIITPFPQSSINAARFLRRQHIQADLIYIDGSHEYDDVMMDLRYYWNILRPGGIMFGDDYCEYWSGVIDAVNEFADINFLRVNHERWDNPNGVPSDYWMVRKS